MCLNGILLIKFTHVLHATAKWPSSRHRQGRYGGKLRNDGSRKSFGSSNFTSARRPRRLPSSDLKQANARLAIRQRVYLFEANISVNKISLPLRAGATLKANTITAPKI